MQCGVINEVGIDGVDEVDRSRATSDVVGTGDLPALVCLLADVEEDGTVAEAPYCDELTRVRTRLECRVGVRILIEVESKRG